MPAITLMPRLLSAPFSLFIGFFDAPEGGTKYYNGDLSSARTWDRAADTTLYAQYQATGDGSEQQPFEITTAEQRCVLGA